MEATAVTLRADTLPLLSLRRLFDVISDGVMMTDAVGVRTYTNAALDQLVGGDARLPLHTSAPPAFLPPDYQQRFTEHLDAVRLDRNGSDIVSLDWQILDQDGDLHEVPATLLSVYDGTAELRGVCWVFLLESATDRVFRVRELETTLERIAGELHRSGVSLNGTRSRLSGVASRSSLSRREVDVFDLLIDGFRVPTIADKLCISTHTVRNHLKSMYRKLGVHSQSELIALVRSNESET